MPFFRSTPARIILAASSGRIASFGGAEPPKIDVATLPGQIAVTAIL